jgi:uncharacterized protein (DUF2236 family)
VRLQRTAGFVSLLTYGSVREIDAAVQHLYAIHEKVTGVAPDGKPYRANDPHLLAWVHATEVDGFLEARRRFGVKDLDKAHADRYVAEMARVGKLMGVGSPPRSTADLDATLRSYVPELDVNRQTREALRFLDFPPSPLRERRLRRAVRRSRRQSPVVGQTPVVAATDADHRTARSQTGHPTRDPCAGMGARGRRINQADGLVCATCRSPTSNT